MKKQTAYLVIIALFFSFTALGQSQELKANSAKNSETKVSLQRSIRLEKDSKPEEIIININQNTLQIDLYISSSISEGRLLIELHDPNDTKQGNFTLETQLNSEKKEEVTGIFQKSLKEPLPGNWKVKIIPAETSGNIHISTNIFE
ncbi:MAG: hypothetical protein ACOCYF_02440 [Bacteroidota bacterium]